MNSDWQSPNPNPQPQSKFYMPPPPQTQYAGFWLRVVASIIDGIAMSFALSIVVSPILRLMGIDLGFTFDLDALANEELSDEALAGIMQVMTYNMGINFVASWFYYALMESSEKQATLGKMALGLKVTDINGNRLDFAKATMRYFAKILSGIILGIGYLMAAFTEKKQALHDLIAGTLIIKTETQNNNYNQPDI